jgi:hypothetical protein
VARATGMIVVAVPAATASAVAVVPATARGAPIH